MTFTWWITKKRAKEMGFTHRAYMFGIIPGFFHSDMSMWASRSDLLNWIEDLLGFLWRAWGGDPLLTLKLGDPL